MLFVGLICAFWGKAAYKSWLEQQSRLAADKLQMILVRQEITLRDQECRRGGGVGAPVLTGKESLNDLLRIASKLNDELNVMESLARHQKEMQSQIQDRRLKEEFLLAPVVLPPPGST